MKYLRCTQEDLPQVLEIYSRARDFMRKTNNPNQWKDSEPSLNLIKKHISMNRLYKLVDSKGRILTVFALIYGEDITYKRVVGGKWISSSPYATIHSIASSHLISHTGRSAILHCLQEVKHIRIDTHKDNKIMQNTLRKLGFIKVGIIYLLNGEERIAFEKII